jgi:hypothetical protein
LAPLFKNLSKALAGLLLVGVLGGIIGLHTRPGHHLLYSLLAEAGKRYDLSFDEKDLYFSLPARIVLQRLSVETQWGPCTLWGICLNLNPLRAYRRLFASPSPSPWTQSLPPELLSCRVQRIDFPPSFPRKELLLQNLRFDRGDKADVLWATVQDAQQQATLKAQMGSSVTFTIQGNVDLAPLHLSHLEIKGSLPSPEAEWVTWSATSPKGSSNTVELQDLRFQGRTHLGPLLTTEMTATVQVQGRPWALEGTGHRNPAGHLEVRAGKVSCQTAELWVETPLLFDLSQGVFPLRGSCCLKTENMGALPFLEGLLAGQGALQVRFSEKAEHPTASFVAQVSSLHYEDWSVARGTVSGLLQGGKTPQLLSLKGSATQLISPYGSLPACSWEFTPKGRIHAVTLTATVEHFGLIRIGGALDLQQGSGVVHVLQGGGLFLRKPLKVVWHEGHFLCSGAIEGKGVSISWEAAGTPENFSLTSQGSYTLTQAPLVGTRTLTGTVTLKGLPFAPCGKLVASLADREHKDFCDLLADLSPQNLRYTFQAQDRWGDFLKGEGALCDQGIKGKASLPDFETCLLTGTLQAKARMGRLLELLGVLPDDLVIDGQLEAALAWSGSLQNPALSGSFGVQEGVFELGNAGTAFHSIHISGIAQGNRLILRSATLRDRHQGQGSITGFLAIFPGYKACTDLHLHLKNLRIIGQDDLEVTALGSIRLSGMFPSLSLTGTLDLPSIDFLIAKSSAEDLGNLRITEIGPHKPKQPFHKNAPLLLPFLCSVTLPCRKVRVHGQSVESLWKGTLRLVGGREKPVALDGMLQLHKGYLGFYGRRLPFTRGKIVYSPRAPLEPQVHLRGRKTLGDLDVLLAVVTTPAKTYFRLTSWPDHSVEDILSLLLFNKFVSELSPPEMAQLLHASAGFQGDVRSPLEVLDTMREFSGIDTVLYNTETLGNAQVNRILTIGKYINNRVFVGVDNELDRNATTLSIQMTLTPRTIFEAKTSGEFGLTWRQPF